MKLPAPLFALLLGILPAPLWAEKHTPPSAFESTHPWITNLELALTQSRKTGKPILAEFR